jgi:glycogen operon protein
LYEHTGRRPYASINFVTCHDGFSLHDLVSYNHKHNEANQQHNQDGESHNLSWNCGAEGPTSDLQIRTLRQRQKRNFLATLLISQGVAMLRAGDELGHTQQGNNNAYCQDNEINWLNWRLSEEDQEFLEFVKQAIHLWKTQPVLQRRQFFQGRALRGDQATDIDWLTPLGRKMSDQDWNAGFVRCLGMRLEGRMEDEVDERGRPIVGDTLLVLLNSHSESIPFHLPAHAPHHYWQPLLDTAYKPLSNRLHAADLYPLQGRALAILRLQHDWAAEWKSWLPGSLGGESSRHHKRRSALAARRMTRAAAGLLTWWMAFWSAAGERAET